MLIFKSRYKKTFYREKDLYARLFYSAVKALLYDSRHSRNVLHKQLFDVAKILSPANLAYTQNMGMIR